ncbi:MAG: cupin domain-containing protein [Candidatus Aminicenantales bacterium]
MINSKPADPKLIGIPLDYRKLVDYQEGSIVSRAIIDKKIGTITVFAFDEDQQLSPHSAPYDALLQVIEGKGLVVIDKKEFPLKAPAAIIMPADIPHAVRAPQRFKMILTMIRSK